MKIVYLHQYFNTPGMPGSTRSYEMARRLVQAGHEVHLVTSDRSPSLCRNRGWYETWEAGIKVHWLPLPYNNNLRYSNRIKVFFEFAIKSASKAASLCGDVVLASSTPLTIALPGIYVSKRNRIPMVFEVRDVWPELPIAIGALRNGFLIWIARKLERTAYFSSTRVVALSPGMKEGVVKAGYPADRVTVIPNCCDLDLFEVHPEFGKIFRQKYSWLRERPLIVYAGALGAINGVDWLVRVASEVKKLDNEICFLVVGDGQEEEKVRKKAAELNVLEENFFLIPPVAKKEMSKILSAADIATSICIELKELWSNSANKFFDALASGTPVAINYGGWQADILRQTGAGLVLDVNNIENAAKTLAQAIRDKRWMESSSNAAKRLAYEKFSKDILSEQFERVILDAVR